MDKATIEIRKNRLKKMDIYVIILNDKNRNN